MTDDPYRTPRDRTHATDDDTGKQDLLDAGIDGGMSHSDFDDDDGSTDIEF